MRICKFLAAVGLALASFLPGNGQVVPQIGAQVWLEPGMASAEIERCFATLDSLHMPVARIFLMWNYIEQPDGAYRWGVFDTAFAAAARHHVRMVVTLMPNYGPPHRGFYYKTQDGAIPKTQAAWDAGMGYVDAAVAHYKNHPAFETWMLANEPGQMPAPDSLAMQAYRIWLAKKYGTIGTLNAAWLTVFADFASVSYSTTWAGGGFTWPVSYVDWQQFWREHLTAYLQAVAARIRTQDAVHGIHVNPHALLEIPHRYQLPVWKNFLTSLGASVHPVWHFGLLTRPEYPLGVGYVTDLIRTAAAPEPFWITELQGGHNMYTADQPIIPTEQEMAQWLWLGVGGGAKRTIFWSLNFRKQGTEAAEWGMLDYAYRPTPRLLAASEVARAIEKVPAPFWATAKTPANPIQIAMSPDTRFIQERSPGGSPARGKYAHQLAVLGAYKALQRLSYPCEIVFTDDPSFCKTVNGDAKRVLIVPHVTALPDSVYGKLRAFVAGGNLAIITGLTGLYDPYERSRLLGDTLLAAITGAKIKEVLPTDAPASIRPGIGNPMLPYATFSAQLEIVHATANPILYGKRVVGARNRLGGGQCVYLPSTVDVAAFTDNAPLSGWLRNTIADFGYKPAFGCSSSTGKVLARQLVTDSASLTLLTNPGKLPASVTVTGLPSTKPQTIYGKAGLIGKGRYQLAGGATFVFYQKR